MWRDHWAIQIPGESVQALKSRERQWRVIYLLGAATMLCAKFLLLIKTGPNHCNLVLFFSCSRNLEHIRDMALPMKVYNTSLPLPALQRLDRCLNALSSNLYRSVGATVGLGLRLWLSRVTRSIVLHGRQNLPFFGNLAEKASSSCVDDKTVLFRYT